MAKQALAAGKGQQVRGAGPEALEAAQARQAGAQTGRIAILSDQPDGGWMYDYRFLEAVR
jgi:hypothetical protein